MFHSPVATPEFSRTAICSLLKTQTIYIVVQFLRYIGLGGVIPKPIVPHDFFVCLFSSRVWFHKNTGRSCPSQRFPAQPRVSQLVNNRGWRVGTWEGSPSLVHSCPGSSTGRSTMAISSPVIPHLLSTDAGSWLYPMASSILGTSVGSWHCVSWPPGPSATSASGRVLSRLER